MNACWRMTWDMGDLLKNDWVDIRSFEWYNEGDFEYELISQTSERNENMKKKVKFTAIGILIAALIGLLSVLQIYTETVLTSAKITDAIRENDREKVEQLLEKHPDTVNKLDFIFPALPETYARYPLQTACELGNYEMAELLVQNGADVNLGTFSPLVLALRHSRNGMDDPLVQLLLDHGADVVVPTQMDYNPLCASVWISTEADRTEKEASLAFFIYITEAYQKEGLRIQDDLIGNLDSILTYAAVKNNLLVVQYLIENDLFSANDKNAAGMNAVCRICHVNNDHNYTELIEYLLSVGSDPYMTDDNGKSAYDYAVEKNDAAAIKLIESMPESTPPIS